MYDVHFDEHTLNPVGMPHPEQFFSKMNRAMALASNKIACTCFLAYIGRISVVAPLCEYCLISFKFDQTNLVWKHYCKRENKRKHAEISIFDGTVFKNRCVTKFMSFLIAMSKNSCESRFKRVAVDAEVSAKTVSTFFYEIFCQTAGEAMSQVGLLGGGMTNPTEIDAMFEGTRFAFYQHQLYVHMS